MGRDIGSISFSIKGWADQLYPRQIVYVVTEDSNFCSGACEYGIDSDDVDQLWSLSEELIKR